MIAQVWYCRRLHQVCYSILGIGEIHACGNIADLSDTVGKLRSLGYQVKYI